MCSDRTWETGPESFPGRVASKLGFDASIGVCQMSEASGEEQTIYSKAQRLRRLVWAAEASAVLEPEAHGGCGKAEK